MSATVYMLKPSSPPDPEEIKEGLRRILARDDIRAALASGGYTGVKMHFGEADPPATVDPGYVKVVVEAVKAGGGKPFLTDTNTLYTGRRFNAVDHLLCAHDHGYTVENTGAPVVILDGLTGRNFTEVEVELPHCKTVKIAADILSMDALVVLTHVTGHMGTGMGAAIKNVGMGLASRGGKQIQHSGILPTVTAEKCVGCGECARWCPADAISVEETAVIDSSLCIGCGECTVSCRHRAISIRWDESSVNLQEKMAEYAFGILKRFRGKSCFFNFLIHVTKDCDCTRRPQKACFDEAAVLASTDIVAVDQATYDFLKEAAGKDPFEEWSGKDALVQVRHAEKIGLGTSRYDLVEIR